MKEPKTKEWYYNRARDFIRLAKDIYSLENAKKFVWNHLEHGKPEWIECMKLIRKKKESLLDY